MCALWNTPERLVTLPMFKRQADFPGILEEMDADSIRHPMLQSLTAIVIFVKMDSHLSGFIYPDKSSILSLWLDNWAVFLLRE